MNSMLSRVREAAHTMTMSAQPTTGRTAIIDIGSNSVRLVVYDGPRRIPFILFNEKVMAGLGAALARTGQIEPEPMERGLRAAERFAHLCRQMKVADIRCVATAAVRVAFGSGLEPGSAGVRIRYQPESRGAARPRSPTDCSGSGPRPAG